MNLSELKSKLLERNVPEEAYSLAGGLPNEAYCLERQTNGHWWTYYSERGLRSGLQTFPTEEEACQYFYEQIMRCIR